MIELKGKNNTAKVFTDNIESKAMGQIIELCNQDFCKDSKIRIMPDTHAGNGCTIGTTMTIKDKVVPNLVGVDIGCGMETIKIAEKEIDFNMLDNIIRKYIPSGFNTRTTEHKYCENINLTNLISYKHINHSRANLSIGTLGGGNHFIEMNKDENGSIYLVIHSGSRNLGKQVAEFYQNLAYENLTNVEIEKKDIIEKFKKEGRIKDIQTELLKIKPLKVNKDLAYLEGEGFNNYIHDMKIVQQFATLNRKAMIAEIVNRMGFTIEDQFTTIHNFIDTESMILRKGAISAKQGEKVLIPINMRDGSLICIGKGNEDWNYSAPHGAGRLMSRSKAKELVTIEEYKDSMKNVWSTSVSEGTIDESPMAYKPMEEIIENIKDTVDIVNIIKPVYNFKAS
jgi:RNA-splicing ligase RtcB